ncbi:hypothetical protein O181_018243 [Austropuccinia psidii MF-1]|uniref:Uncharacterized protein n=1 Tax=Austropuccinia psidii MF-1 TaxID=1389203 RepID=A0A9Q3C8P8_9BASI|nr:hypothetical protein [Austropuccinia psidii MF-1]
MVYKPSCKDYPKKPKGSNLLSSPHPPSISQLRRPSQISSRSAPKKIPKKSSSKGKEKEVYPSSTFPLSQEILEFSPSKFSKESDGMNSPNVIRSFTQAF